MFVNCTVCADPEGKEFVDKDGTVYTQHVDEEGNIFIMKKDPVTGKMVKTSVRQSHPLVVTFKV